MPDHNPTPSRPDVPAGYGIPNELTVAGSWDAVAGKIAASRNYWVATTRPDGRPHVMPVWGVWLEDQLLFSTDRASRKARNIAANPSIAVHLESGDDVVVLEGGAREIADAGLLARYADAYHTKYAFRLDPADAATVTFALRPAVAFAWLEAGFPASATRWTFE